MTIQEMLLERKSLHEAQKKLNTKAVDEKRNLTAEEQQEWDKRDAREGTREQIAKRFGVGDRWIRKWLQRRRETDSIAPLPRNPGRKRAPNDRRRERLRRLIQKRPDTTLAELGKSLRVKISIAALHRAVGVLGLTLKKVARGGEAKVRRPSRTAATRKWPRACVRGWVLIAARARRRF